MKFTQLYKIIKNILFLNKFSIIIFPIIFIFSKMVFTMFSLIIISLCFLCMIITSQTNLIYPNIKTKFFLQYIKHILLLFNKKIQQIVSKKIFIFFCITILLLYLYYIFCDFIMITILKISLLFFYVYCFVQFIKNKIINIFLSKNNLS